MHSVVLHKNHLMGRKIAPNNKICLLEVLQEVLVDSFSYARSRVIGILALGIIPSLSIVVWICLLLRLIIVAYRSI